MVDTSDEWIMQRVGIKERRILKGENQGTSVMGANAVEGLLEKTGTSPDEIDLLVCATVTPDMLFPATANIICDKVGIKNAFSFDINAACSGFLFALQTAANFIESGRYKKVILVGADKMSSITDYTDRTTCPLFGDAAGAVLIEASDDETGIMDHIIPYRWNRQTSSLYESRWLQAPSSHETIDAKRTFYFPGRTNSF